MMMGCAAPMRVSELPRTPWPGVGEPTEPPDQGDRKPDPKPKEGISSRDRGRDRKRVPRSEWTQARPDVDDVNMMNGVNRITLHHEGMEAITTTSYRKTLEEVRAIRHSHVHARGWSDIGYHFIVDRAGRVWEGRPIRYQGAHVTGHNKHNVGVVALGNFNRQSPTEEQIQGMVRIVRKLQAKYDVPADQIYTHRELGSTACPGRRLQARIERLRSNGRFR